MLIAAPMLIIPLAVLLWLDDEVVPSPIELAIAALPMAGDSTSDTAGASPLGRIGSRLPNNVTLPLFANSAQVEAGRLGRADSASAAQHTDTDFASAEFAALHPRSLFREDLLIGSLRMVYSLPNIDLSIKMFEEYCNASPNEASYQVPLAALPIDPSLRQAFGRLATTAAGGGPLCARLYRDDS